jgi:hypothetical protein
LKVGTWTIRPMEVRILPARVPDLPAARGPVDLPYPSGEPIFSRSTFLTHIC